MNKFIHYISQAILLYVLFGPATSDNPPRKNVLFFMADDLRPEIGVYAQQDETFNINIQTPNFDALAEDSLVMTRAYCQFGVCGPSRNSFLTGVLNFIYSPIVSVPYVNDQMIWQ